MKPKLLLLTLLLALTLAACAPARSEPESGSEASAPSSQAEEQPSEPSSSGSESSSEPAAPEESSAPESQQPRTLPDWADELFYTAVEDWAGGTRTAGSLVERYGDLIVSDRYFRLANEDGSLSGWIELGRDGAIGFSMGCRSIPLTGKPCGGSFSCLSEATFSPRRISANRSWWRGTAGGRSIQWMASGGFLSRRGP